VTTWIILALAIVPSIIFHEVSHGVVAYWCGDMTAKIAGRLTLNPISHVDPVGSLLLPAIMIFSGLPPFGWAKPVPVSVNRLRRPRRDSLLVSFAGPSTNIILSLIAWTSCKSADIAGLIYGPSPLSQWTVWLISFGVDFGIVNLTLAIFNLIPIPPLDGSALLEAFVPQRRLGQYFAFRNKALPIVMVLFILDSFTLHLTGHALGWFQNVWINSLG